MKKKLISRGLYAEGLRQLRVFGFIVLALYLVGEIAEPLLTYAEYLHWSNMAAYTYMADPVGAQALLGALGFLPTVVAPVMVLILFSHFNKRADADFYHSLPYTRLCIFFSFGAAILTWVFSLGIISSATSVLMHLAFPKLYAVSFAGFWTAIANYIVMILMVVFAVMLGCSITGTLLANITATGLILFLPRLLIYMISSCIVGTLPFLTESSTLPFFSARYNILIYYLAGQVTNWQSSGGSSNCGALLYSFLVALVMGVLAAVLFCRRKSETAGQPAPGKRVQAAIRIALTMCLATIGTCMLATSRSEDIFSVILLYVLALLVYFIYELLSTLKWRNLLHAVPGLAIVVLLNILIYAGILGTIHLSASFRPAANEIQSVRLVTSTDRSYSDDYYAEKLTEKVEITDPKILQLVSDALQENLKNYDNGKYESVYYSQNSLSTYSYKLREQDAYVSKTVAIRTATGTHFRTIYFSAVQIQTLMERLSTLEEYRTAYMTLPEPLKGTISFWTRENYPGPGIADYDDWDMSAILDCLQAEINEVGFETWAGTLSYLPVEAAAHIEYKEDSASLDTVSLPISREVTPKTLDLLLKMYYENNTDAVAEVLDLMKNWTDYDGTGEHEPYLLITFGKINEDGSFSEWQLNAWASDKPHASSFSFYVENVETCLAQLADQILATDDVPRANAYLYVRFAYEDQDDDREVYLPLPDTFHLEDWEHVLEKTYYTEIEDGEISESYYEN